MMLDFFFAGILALVTPMTADKRLNLWLASDTSERDALAAVEGVALGDFCLVGGENLYVLERSREMTRVCL